MMGVWISWSTTSQGPAPGRLLDATPADFEQGFTVHLFAAQILVQSFVDGMTKRGFGRILNVISTSVREPIPNLGVSNTVRGAMASWAKTSLESCHLGLQ